MAPRLFSRHGVPRVGGAEGNSRAPSGRIHEPAYSASVARPSSRNTVAFVTGEVSLELGVAAEAREQRSGMGGILVGRLVQPLIDPEGPHEVDHGASDARPIEATLGAEERLPVRLYGVRIVGEVFERVTCLLRGCLGEGGDS